MKKFLLFLTLLVSAIGAQATNYKLVTSDSELEVGANYIIVAKGWYTLGTAKDNNFEQQKISDPVNDVISIDAETIKVITLESSSDPKHPYQLKVEVDGISKYLYAAGGTSKNYLRAAETPQTPATATASISIAAKGSAATIKFNIEGKDARNLIRYNSSNKIFSCYSSGQADVYLYKEVTSGEDPKIATSISFEKASYKINLGDTFTAPTPTLKGIPEGATLSWESSNTDVATVDAGNVTLRETAGTTTITASYAGDDTHAAATASYTLKVIDPNATIIDSFGYSDLTFSATTNQYSTFTYTSEESGAEYAGFAYRGTTYIQIKDQKKDNAVINAGIYVSKAPANYKIAKIVITTATNSTSKAALTVYGSTSDFTSVTESDDQIGSITGVGTLTIDFHDSENAAIYGKSFTAFSIRGNSDGAYQVSSVEVVWEPLQEGDIKQDPGLAYSPAEVTLVEGDELAEQPTFSNPNNLTVTYSSGNTDVATVDAKTGVISLAGGLGTAVITASTEGDATHKAGSATFTLTVKKAQVAYLVTDASTLKVDDIIIIANQDEAMAISNEEKTDYRAATAITFNSDKSEIHSISNDVMLFKLGVWTEHGKSYWVLNTTNYTKNGALYCSSGTTSSLNIDTPKNDLYDAVITIDQETGEAKIAFNKGAESGANIVRYDSTSDLFNCYTASNSQEPVYIYKVVDGPATVNVNTELSKINFVEKVNASDNNVINLTANFSTSSSYNKVAIYMEDVLVGIYDVTDAKVNASFDHVPYLPNAEFTMRPVLADIEGNPTQFGPSEALSLTWPNINSYGAVELDNTLVWIGSDADPLPEKATLGAISYFDLDIPTGSFLYYYVDVVAKNQSSGVAYNGEFAWCEGGFSYAVNPYLENVPVDTDRTPDLSKIETFPTIEFSITPIYKFDVAEKYRSLVPAAATPRPARVASSTITDGVQTVVCDAKPAESKFYATSKVSGVEGVTVDANAPVEFFNLQGVRVDGDLAPGIYIRRQGQAVSKVRIN